EHLGEVGQFWLRKSRKPVLAVLLVEKRTSRGDVQVVVHRGMNCEVSMPTGSLCAERNAIGSALANDPTLLRQSLKMIAVLSSKMDTTDLNPLAPCGACNEWLLKIAEANPSFKIVTFDSIDCDSVYIHQLL
ncbi:hypothetical protein DYB25_013327, partial [Aphanomyces astaci]